MELKYCDGCGAIFTVDFTGGDKNLYGSYFCDSCAQRGRAKRSNRGRESDPPETADELTESLELFSPGQAEGASSGQARPPKGSGSSRSSRSSRPSGSSRSARSSAPKAGPAGSSAKVRKRSDTGKRKLEFSLDPSMELFSAETVVVKKKQHFGKTPPPEEEVTPELLVDEKLKEDNRPSPVLEPNPSGSTFPAGTATRLQFRCLDCKSTLMVKPVKKTSKLVCPRCSERMYINKEGRVAKNYADLSSSFVRSGAGTVIPNLARSSREPKKGKASSSEEGASEDSASGSDAPGASERVPRQALRGAVSSSTPEDFLRGIELEAIEDICQNQPQPAPKFEPPSPARSGDPSAGGPQGVGGPPELAWEPGEADGSAETPPWEEKNPTEPTAPPGGPDANLAVAREEGEAPVSRAPPATSEVPPTLQPPRVESSALPSAAPVPQPSGVEESRSSDLAALCLAALFGLLLAAPLLLLGFLVSPETAAAGPESSGAHEFLRELGRTVQTGIDRLADQLVRWAG